MRDDRHGAAHDFLDAHACSGLGGPSSATHLHHAAFLPRALRKWWNALVQRRAAKRDERFLASQPDYILRDIGIGRGEIEFAVRGRGRR